jgi:hypothetical protein
LEVNRLKGIKPKMGECKLKSGANGQGTLKEKGVKQGVGVQ